MLNISAQIGDSVDATFFMSCTGVRSLNLVNGLPLLPKEGSLLTCGDVAQVCLLRLADDRKAYVVEEVVIHGNHGGQPRVLQLLAPRAENFEGDITESVLLNLQQIGVALRLEMMFDLIEFETTVRHRLPLDQEKEQFPHRLNLMRMVSQTRVTILQVHRYSYFKRQVAYLRLATYIGFAHDMAAFFEDLLSRTVPSGKTWLPSPIFLNPYTDGDVDGWSRKADQMNQRIDRFRPSADITAADIAVMRACAYASERQMVRAKQILDGVDPQATASTCAYTHLLSVSLALGQFEEAHHHLTQLVCKQLGKQLGMQKNEQPEL